MKNIQIFIVTAMFIVTANISYADGTCTITNSSGYSLILNNNTTTTIENGQSYTYHYTNNNQRNIDIALNIPNFSQLNLKDGDVTYNAASNSFTVSAATTPNSFTNNSPFWLYIISDKNTPNNAQDDIIGHLILNGTTNMNFPNGAITSISTTHLPLQVSNNQIYTITFNTTSGALQLQS